MLSSSGISFRHGPHHVAQKLTITTWPLRLESLMGLPVLESSVKSGAGAEAPAAPAGRAAIAPKAASAAYAPARSRERRVFINVTPGSGLHPTQGSSLEEYRQPDIRFE